MKRTIVIILSAASLLGIQRQGWAVPTGMNPYIYGMHDNPGPGLLNGPNNCGRGWITLLFYIGTSGTCGAGSLDFADMANEGYGIIMRLDSDYAPPMPTDPAQYDGFAASFADCVNRSSGIKVWIVGNEPNMDIGGTFTPQAYGEIYYRVYNAVKALPQGDEHEVLFASPALWGSLPPWGYWDDGLSASIGYVLGKPGGVIDGASIHAYSRIHSAASITSDEWFWGFDNKWHMHFRIYRDFMRIYAQHGLYDIPLYITEAGAVCDPICTPYEDQDLGFFYAMYEEIHAWNQANPSQIVRAVTPYRWTLNDDGTGRNFCIGCRPNLVQDLQNAIAMGRKWHDSDCHQPFGQQFDAGPGPDSAAATNDAGIDGSGPPGDGATHTADGQASADSSSGSGLKRLSTGCGCRAHGFGFASSGRRGDPAPFPFPLPLLILILISVLGAGYPALRRRQEPPVGSKTNEIL